jgi:hypothetical protein
VRQGAVVEAGHPADLLSGQGQHEQPARVKRGGVQVGDVDAERGLLVGPGGDQAEGATRPEGDHREELSREVASRVFDRDGRHAQADVVAEQRDEAVEVVGLIRPDHSFDEALLFG